MTSLSILFQSPPAQITNHLPLFIKVIVALIIIVAAAQLFGRAIRLIGQPAVVGEMIAGVFLGPTCFGYFLPELAAETFPSEVKPILFVISNLGLSFYMFLVGCEVDLKLFNRTTAKDASVLSLAALIVPFAFAALTVSMFGDDINAMKLDFASLSIFLGTAFAITAFPMLARILQERGIVNTRIGVLSLMTASIQDVITWILLAFVTAMASTRDYSKLPFTVGGAIVLVLILFFVMRPLLTPLARRVLHTEDLSSGTLAIVIILLLTCALVTDKLDLYSVFGGFLCGVALPREGQFIKAIIGRLRDITVLLLLPVFFTFSGLNTDMTLLGNLSLLVPTIVIVAFAFASKYIPCTLSMKFISGFSWRESSAIGGLINSRGLMELIVANIGLFYGLIDISLFSILVLIAITTTLGALPIYNMSMGKDKPKKTEKLEGIGE
jgi:Kef-type K+ transport system membrane component KefB